MNIRNTLLLIAATCVLFACSDTQMQEREHSILAFGTLITINLFDVDAQSANKAFADLEVMFQKQHKEWNPWVEGELKDINHRIASGKASDINPEMADLIIRSQQLSADTEGLFNPAIGQLINLWRFHEYKDPDKVPPKPAEIKAVLERHPKMSDLELKETHLSSRNPAVQLNFGAFAKGYAVDLAIEHLKSMGIRNAIVNTGGDLRAIGRHGNRPWRIGIRHPRAEGVIASIQIDGDESVYTSGDYERYFYYDGKRYHHILDPRTGYPAWNAQSVTVIHHDGAVADAAATALLIAGADGWHRIAKRLGLKYVMLIDSEGRIHMNPAMARRIHFEIDNNPPVIVSAPL